ncbi:MAG: divalent-cation tolerance protein CutA [Vicinamibacterales bacterium]
MPHAPPTSPLVQAEPVPGAVPVRLVLTTLPASADAAAVARDLVERRLAACVGIGAGVRSVYRWKGGVEDEAEVPLVIKTTDERIAALETRLREVHPYEVPEFVVLQAGASEAYGAWLVDAVAGDAPAAASEPGTPGQPQSQPERLKPT